MFEAVGLLLGQEELPAEQQLAALNSLLQPLMQQIKSNLQPAAAEQQAADGGGGSVSGSSGSWGILQAMEAIARLNKGFKWELCTRSRPQLGESGTIQRESIILQGSAVLLSHDSTVHMFLWGMHA